MYGPSANNLLRRFLTTRRLDYLSLRAWDSRLGVRLRASYFGPLRPANDWVPAVAFRTRTPTRRLSGHEVARRFSASMLQNK